MCWCEDLLWDHPELAGPGEGLGAVFRAQLAVDVARVALDGAHGDEEIPGEPASEALLVVHDKDSHHRRCFIIVAAMVHDHDFCGNSNDLHTPGTCLEPKLRVIGKAAKKP